MPTYQYACTVCDHRFDAVQSFSDDALTRCPECDGALRKVYSAVGVVFKGSGFYRNDSRPAGKVGAGTADGNSNGAAAKGDGVKSDSNGSKSDGAKTDGAPAAAPANGSSGSSTPVAAKSSTTASSSSGSAA